MPKKLLFSFRSKFFKISEINVTLSEFNGIKNVLIGGLGGAKFETFEG